MVDVRRQGGAGPDDLDALLAQAGLGGDLAGGGGFDLGGEMGEVEMPAPRRKAKRRPGQLSRPGEGIKPSEVLNHIGWTIWGFSWLATTNAIRYVTFAVVSFLLGLAGVEVPLLVVHGLALLTGGALAWVVQTRITALERPMFTGHFSLSAGLAVVVDLMSNYGGVKFASPWLLTVFGWELGGFWMFALAIALTLLAEAFLVWSLIEKRKGF